MTDKAPTTEPLTTDEEATLRQQIDREVAAVGVPLRITVARLLATLDRDRSATASVIQRVEDLPDLEMGYHPQLRQGYRRGISTVLAILRGGSR